VTALLKKPVEPAAVFAVLCAHLQRRTDGAAPSGRSTAE
jgi:hypothetical protein